jgi:hypothetical protein
VVDGGWMRVDGTRVDGVDGTSKGMGWMVGQEGVVRFGTRNSQLRGL